MKESSISEEELTLIFVSSGGPQISISMVTIGLNTNKDIKVSLLASNSLLLTGGEVIPIPT